MKVIDISQTLEDTMICYPSLKRFELNWLRNYDKGDRVNLSQISLASHVGTHVDAPYHYIKEGKKLKDIDLEIFYGPVKVVEVPRDKRQIDIEFLKKIGEIPDRILFKTRNSELYGLNEFTEEYVYIEREAANYLAESSVCLIGIDYFSVDKYKSPGKEAHLALLSKDIVLLEGIILREVEEGSYLLACFPLKVKEGEAAPCRAVLIESPDYK